MAYKYPIDVCTSQNRKQTYSVESHLVLARTENNQSPLKIFDDTFSLYKHAIIEKDAPGNEKAVTANIKIREMEDIFKRTEFALQKSLEDEIAPVANVSSDIQNSPAFTVKITSGILKGRTPAQVLIENPEQRTALNNQYEWLKNNLAKYPNNQKQMDAIKDAARLQKEGKLSDAETATVAKPRVRIYPPALPVIPKPLRRKQREDGKCFIYEMEIYWNIGDQFPVELIIRNYWAPVKVMEDKTLRVVKSEAADKVEKSMRLGEADWLNHVRTMKDDMDTFKMVSAKVARNDADTAYFENRSNSGATS